MDNDFGKISRAAERGDLSLFAEMHKCGFILKDRDALSAAQNGHLNILQYMYAHGYDLRHGGTALALKASEGGHLPLLQWLEEKDAITYSRDWCLERAANRDHRHVVEWLLETWPQDDTPSARAQDACESMRAAFRKKINEMVNAACSEALNHHTAAQENTSIVHHGLRILHKFGL